MLRLMFGLMMVTGSLQVLAECKFDYQANVTYCSTTYYGTTTVTGTDGSFMKYNSDTGSYYGTTSNNVYYDGNVNIKTYWDSKGRSCIGTFCR